MPPFTATPTTTLASPAFAPFQRRLVLFLVPYFRAATADFDVACAEVLETLSSYRARTRSEFITAARIIAFSFSALDLLAEARSTEMPPAIRLRFTACANSLHRSSQQDERALTRRLACDTASPVAEPLATSPATSVPTLADATTESDYEAALQHAQAQMATCRNRLSGNRPATSPQPPPATHRNREKRSDIMMNILAELARPAQPPV